MTENSTLDRSARAHRQGHHADGKFREVERSASHLSLVPARPWDLNSDDFSLTETKKVIESDNVTVETLAEILDNGGSCARMVASTPYANKDVAFAIHAHIEEVGVAEEWRHSAANPTCPPEVLADYVARARYESDFELAEAVAGNPSTPADTLDKLNQTMDDEVREAVALNPSTSDKTLLDQIARGDEVGKVAHTALNERRAIEEMEAERLGWSAGSSLPGADDEIEPPF